MTTMMRVPFIRRARRMFAAGAVLAGFNACGAPAPKPVAAPLAPPIPKWEDVPATTSRANQANSAVEAEARPFNTTVAGQTSLITWQPKESYDFDRNDRTNWHTADWANGGVFNNVWKPQNVRFENGFLSLVLEKRGSSYVSGEYRTNKEYLYGCFETRMKAASGAGLMAGSFFTYTGTFGKSDHHEIDIEHLGQDPQLVQFDYHTAGRHHPEPYMLGFDATVDFHNYGFKWSEKELVFYVDGQPVKTVTSDIPAKPGKLMVNLWAGTREVQDWLGGYYKGGRQAAVYDWIKYSPIAECAAKEGTAPAVIQEPAKVARPENPAAGSLTGKIASIARGTHDSQDIPIVLTFQIDDAPKGTKTIKMYFYTNKEWYQGSADYKGPGKYEFRGSVWKGHKHRIGNSAGQNTSITVILRAGSKELETDFTIDRVR